MSDLSSVSRSNFATSLLDAQDMYLTFARSSCSAQSGSCASALSSGRFGIAKHEKVSHTMILRSRRVRPTCASLSKISRGWTNSTESEFDSSYETGPGVPATGPLYLQRPWDHLQTCETCNLHNVTRDGPTDQVTHGAVQVEQF